MPRYKVTLAYHGAPFKGFQRQQGLPTVQGNIEQALQKLCGGNFVDVYAAGRTDQGVHALGQVIHFDTLKHFKPYTLQAGLNHFLNPHISIVDAQEANDTFHARFDAISRTYHYHMWVSSTLCPLKADQAWHVSYNLNVNAMEEAAQYCLGEHDFSAFRSHECQSKSPHKKLDVLERIDSTGFLTWRIKARSFLHHQVRFIMGALVQVGRGKQHPEWIQFLLKQKDIKPHKAPAHGLCFMNVEY